MNPKSSGGGRKKEAIFVFWHDSVVVYLARARARPHGGVFIRDKAGLFFIRDQISFLGLRRTCLNLLLK